jgi:AcrR family transcriptional regulator
MKDDTHERILDGTTELVARRGFRPGRLEEIAEHIGVSVKTIYNHFGSKRALVIAVVQRDLDGLFGHFNEVLDREDLSFPEKVHDIISFGLERARLHTPGWFQLMGVPEPGITQHFLPQLRQRFLKVFHRLWEQGRDADAIDAHIDGDTMGYALLFLIEGFLGVSREESLTRPSHELLRRALNMHLFGLLSPEARRSAAYLLQEEHDHA